MSGKKRWDAIVVGSGITGGWAAKALTEAGLETLVLEAGRAIDPARDFREHVPNWQAPMRGLGDAAAKRAQPVQSLCDGWSELNANLFVDDRDHPYATGGSTPFWWFRARQVGGRSLTWARRCWRWSDLDFRANEKDGAGIPWPIGYPDLAPFYDEVESFIGVAGESAGLAQLPDGKFLPPMALSCGERVVQTRLAGAFGGRRVVIPARTATLTQAHGGRAACHFCGPCERGCVTGSYFSSNSSTLPAAAATGRLTLRSDSVVSALVEKDGRIDAARVIDAATGETREERARLFFLCAGSIESVRLLMLSKLAGTSGALGRHLMDQLCAGGASGLLPELDAFDDPGRRPTGIAIPRFVNLGDPASATKDHLRGYSYQGEGRRLGVRGFFQRPFSTIVWPTGATWGEPFKRALSRGGPWTFSIAGFGECLPRAENRVELDATMKDRFGLPAARITFSWGENEKAMWKAMRARAAETLEAAKVASVGEFGDAEVPSTPGRAVHEMGGARMGDDPKQAVLDRWNRAHDHRNLFVTDGACMTSSGGVNPSLTYMALTLRAARFAADALKKDEL